nr:MAG TPA: hypothetical protein [Bacteriophage sp.]
MQYPAYNNEVGLSSPCRLKQGLCGLRAHRPLDLYWGKFICAV